MEAKKNNPNAHANFQVQVPQHTNRIVPKKTKRKKERKQKLIVSAFIVVIFLREL